MNNKYELSSDGSHYRIYFRDGSFFIIDEEDFTSVSKYSWNLGKRGYPIAHTSRSLPEGPKTVPVHKIIMPAPKGMDIDHISGDKMDNRKQNLRICTHQQNSFNQRMRSTNTSGFYGVSKHASGKYEAYVHHDGHKNYIGLFDTAEAAAAARDELAEKLFGKFAKLNRDLIGA